MLFLYSFIMGSYDKDDGAQMYMIDPSGVSHVSVSNRILRIQFFDVTVVLHVKCTPNGIFNLGKVL